MTNTKKIAKKKQGYAKSCFRDDGVCAISDSKCDDEMDCRNCNLALVMTIYNLPNHYMIVMNRCVRREESDITKKIDERIKEKDSEMMRGYQ